MSVDQTRIDNLALVFVSPMFRRKIRLILIYNKIMIDEVIRQRENANIMKVALSKCRAGKCTLGGRSSLCTMLSCGFVLLVLHWPKCFVDFCS